MINLVYTPQRADFKAEYTVMDDTLKIRIGDKIEVFDFTDLDEGVAEEIIIEVLPVNPIVKAEKIDDAINVTVFRYYSFDEKHVFEVEQNG